MQGQREPQMLIPMDVQASVGHAHVLMAPSLGLGRTGRRNGPAQLGARLGKEARSDASEFFRESARLLVALAACAAWSVVLHAIGG